MKRPLSALLLILLLIFVGDHFASADPQQDESIVETIIRLPNFDIASSAKAKISFRADAIGMDQRMPAERQSQ